MHSTNHLVLAADQVWLLVIGIIVPLGGYILNRALPLVSEAAKAGVHVVLAAIAGVLYTAVETHVIGFNSATLQLVLTAVVAALTSHHLLWKPAGLSNASVTTPKKTVLSGD